MDEKNSNFILAGIVFLILLLAGSLFFFKDIQQKISNTPNSELPPLPKTAASVEVLHVPEAVVVPPVAEVVVPKTVDTTPKSPVAPETKDTTLTLSNESTKSTKINTLATPAPAVTFSKEKLATLKGQLLEFCLVKKDLTEEEGKKRLFEVINSSLGTTIDSNSSVDDVESIMLSAEVAEVIQSIDEEKCVDKNP